MHLTSELVDFVEACAARRATPGGGAAAALTGALGTALGEMAAAYTVPRPGRKAEGGEDDRAGGLEATLVSRGLAQLKVIREALLPLIESDCEAYENVVIARKASSKGPAGDASAAAELERALERAIDVPLQGSRLCVKALTVLEGMAVFLNPNLVSDTATCALLLAAAFRGFQLNVRINLGALGDDERKRAIEKESRALTGEVGVLEGKILRESEKILAR